MKAVSTPAKKAIEMSDIMIGKRLCILVRRLNGVQRYDFLWFRHKNDEGGKNTKISSSDLRRFYVV
jgi:hypothetical protein